MAISKAEAHLNKLLKKYAAKLPKFEDGRIDYRTSKSAPVVNVFLIYKGKLLLLKRSDKVGAYKRTWGSIAGYLDDFKSLQHKVLEEIREETGITKRGIAVLHYGKVHTRTDRKINMKWIIYPVLVTLRGKPMVKIDWEHTEYRWINPKELKNYNTFPRLPWTFRNANK